MKLQDKKTEPLQSTELPKETLPLSPQEPKTGTLHRTCKTLPLYNFIECYCNNDLNYLIISGTATKVELQDAWEEVYLEYTSLIKNEKSSYLFDLEKRITLLEYHIKYIDHAKMFLHYGYDEEIANEVRGMGYKLNAEFGSQDYFKQLDLMVSRCKTRIFELGELEEEFKRLLNTVEAKPQNEEDLNITIAMLSKHQGYHINKKETTVLEFCSILNLYLKEIAHRNKQQDIGRG